MSNYYRVQLVDEVSTSHFEVRVKKKWYSPWVSIESLKYYSYNKQEIQNKIVEYVERIMESDCVLYDSRE